MIYLFLATGFEEIEAITTVDILRRAELEVKTVGVSGKIVAGAHDIAVECDITEAEVKLEDAKMIILPGGMPGTLNLEKSQTVQDALDYAVKNNIWIAAICAAPSILGHKNMLKGKTATCYPSFETQLGEGAIHSTDRVVRDGKIITGKGPGAAVEFAVALVEVMATKEIADKVLEELF